MSGSKRKYMKKNVNSLKIERFNKTTQFAD